MGKTKRWFGAALIAAAFAIAACASIEPPRNVQDGLAYSYASVASARNTAASLLQSGRINVEDAKKVQAIADDARALLDASRLALTTGDQVSAQQKLQLAQALLAQISEYLNPKGVSP